MHHSASRFIIAALITSALLFSGLAPVAYAETNEDPTPMPSSSAQSTLPLAEPTSIMLSSSVPTAKAEENITLTAEVLPATATGSVEFRNAEDLLGDSVVEAGVATLETTPLPSAEYSFTASFVPREATNFAASVSEPVTVLVSATAEQPSETETAKTTPAAEVTPAVESEAELTTDPEAETVPAEETAPEAETTPETTETTPEAENTAENEAPAAAKADPETEVTLADGSLLQTANLLPRSNNTSSGNVWVLESGEVTLATKLADDENGPALGIGSYLGGGALGDTDWIPAEQAILSLPYQDTHWPGSDYAGGTAGRTRWENFSNPETRDWRTAPRAINAIQYTQNELRLYTDTSRVTATGVQRRSTYSLNSVTTPDGSNTPGTFLGYQLVTTDGSPVARTWDSENITESGTLSATSTSSIGWAFSAPGIYCVTITAAVGAVNSATNISAVYTVTVGTDPSTVTPCTQPNNETEPEEPDPEEPDPDGTTPILFKSTGHVDLAVGDTTDGQWQLKTASQLLKDAIWVIRGEASTYTVPQPSEINDYTFLGEAGTTFWGASSSDIAGALWPGLASDWSSNAAAPQSRLSWTLRGVSGPGEVWVYGTNTAAGIHYSTVWGLPASHSTSAGAHEHMNWSFTQPGVYCLNFDVSGRMADGTDKHAGGQLTIAVGDVDLETAIPCERQDAAAPVGTLSPIANPETAVSVAEYGKIAFLPYLDGNSLRIVTGLRATAKSDLHYADPESLILATSKHSSSGYSLGDAAPTSGRQQVPSTIFLDTIRAETDIRLSIGEVSGPGDLTMFRARTGTSATVFSYHDGSVSEDPEGIGATLFLAGHQERRVFSRASAYGIYCVPITWSTTTAAGETSATTTLTYVFGSDDPDADDYVDRSKVVPCAQGGSASEPSGGDDDEPAPDLAHVPNHSQTDSGQLIINVGHVDVASQLVSGELVTKIKDTSESVIPEYHSTDDVVLQLLPDSESAVPDSAEFAFLGASGAPLWQVTQTQQEDLIWPGWSTEEIPVEATTGGIDWTLARMEGPGAFVLYELGDFGVPHVLLNTRDGVTAADKLTIPKNTHAHGSWAFSAEGVYCLGFTRSATLTDGTNVSNDFTLAFAVGNVDVKSVNPAGCFSEGADPDPTDPDPTDPDPTDPDPTDPDPTDPDPTDPDQDGDDDPDDPTPTPDAVWDVPNGTVNNKGATVLNAGHVDIASLLEDGKLDTKIKDTTSSSNPVWRDTGKTVLQLLPDSATAVPANSAYHFLGDTGATIYQVTQTQQAGLLWPGWSTETIPLTATQGGVDWSLLDSTGPGEFALYETDSFGQPKVHFNTRDGITAADKLTIPKNTHAHGSWAFSAEGVYCLAMQRSTQLPSGQTVTDEFSLAVAVGTADVMDADPASCAGEGTVPDPGDLPPDPNDTTPDPEDTTPADNGDSATTVVKPPAAKKCVSGAMILSSGHIDYATRIVGGKLRSLIGDGTASKKVYREPSGTVLWLKPASKVTLPSGYGQIGAAGSSVWQVPQTQKSGLIWLGWSTESLSAANVQGPVTWKINKVSGPGTMKVYLSGAFGGIQAMIFNNGGSYSIPLGVHAHANWAFSAQGIYRIKMTQTATLANGKVSSDTDTLTIAVGNVDPAKAGSGSGCGTVSNATLLSNEDLETELESTEPDATDAADAAITAPDWLPEQQSPARDEDEPPIVPAPPQNDPVPVLLVTLGVLLLLGAAGTGLLWWRRRKNAGPRA